MEDWEKGLLNKARIVKKHGWGGVEYIITKDGGREQIKCWFTDVRDKGVLQGKSWFTSVIEKLMLQKQ